MYRWFLFNKLWNCIFKLPNQENYDQGTVKITLRLFAAFFQINCICFLKKKKRIQVLFNLDSLDFNTFSVSTKHIVSKNSLVTNVNSTLNDIYSWILLTLFLSYFKAMYITLKWIHCTFYCFSQEKGKTFSVLKCVFIVFEEKLSLKIIGLRKTSGFSFDL